MEHSFPCRCPFHPSRFVSLTMLNGLTHWKLHHGALNDSGDAQSAINFVVRPLEES